MALDLMNTDALKRKILENTREVTRLDRRIHETFEMRGKNRASRDAWVAACAEFHSKYNELAFPGGYKGAEVRIMDGDPYSIEAALCFLELRPYFFRSGYMYQSLLRKMKRAVLTQEQSERFKAVLVRVEEWRRRKVLARKV
jgi:hypothetical protein